MNLNFNKECGQVSRILLVLAIVLLIAIIIVYVVMRFAERPPKPPEPGPVEEQPIHDLTLNDVRFVYMDAVDMGDTLYGSQSSQSNWQKDLTTSDRFIKVTIGVQNKGKMNVPERAWDLGNIIDSEGRNYEPLDYSVKNWLPDPDLCGSLLKPELELAPCVKMYEVSKVSTGLKVEVQVGKKKSETEYETSDKDRDTALLDLIVTQ